MSYRSNTKRWNSKRKTAVVMDILKGKTTTTEDACRHDLTVSREFIAEIGSSRDRYRESAFSPGYSEVP